ncbi:MAG TPA: galactose oxidase-like domain-containing protein [Acidimicrobiales bacterium]|nr:galactose oxidase-like domain-containing protein [Acidimicrobiales bacterium]
MRKGLTALVTVLGVLALVAAPGAHADDPAQVGSFSKPFREDAFKRPGTGGCVAQGAIQDCLPSANSTIGLANGKVLYWSALAGLESPQMSAVVEGGDLTVDDKSRVVEINTANPAQSQWAEPTPTNGGANPNGNTGSDVGAPSDAAKNDGDLFCADQVQLADGRILATGGTDYYQDPRLTENLGVIELEGLKNTRIFNPADNTWSQTGSMNYGRWYPSIVTLPDSKIVVAGGVTKLLKPLYTDAHDMGNSLGNVRQTETYDPAAGKWTENGATAEKSLPLFPRLHLLPDGHVYFDAAGQAFNPAGEDYMELFWNQASSYDPTSKTWKDLGVPGVGIPDLTQIGFRGSTFSVALPLKPPYDSESFLSGGGVLFPTPGSYLPVASSRINTVKIGKDGSETLSTTATGAMTQARWYSTGVALPDGTVAAFSGATADDVDAPGLGFAIKQAELFTPDGKGGGTWSPLATASQERTYHNTAILLPTGQVLVAGHAPIPAGYYKQMTLPGFENNIRDASLELYNPPYMSRGDRPVIRGLGDRSFAYGSGVTIPTADAASIKSVVLIRNPALTHLVDGDQRTVELPITSTEGGVVKVSVPDNKAVLPPGPYMLFINKGSDKGLIPSVAAQVFVGAPVPQYVAAPAAASGPTVVQGAQTTRPAAVLGAQLPATGAVPWPAVVGVALLLVALPMRRVGGRVAARPHGRI